MTETIILEGELEMNCYLIIEGSECYIVDPGFEKEKIQSEIKKRDLKVLGILLTHAHFDHIGAIDAFDVPIYLSEKEVPIFRDCDLNGYGYFEVKPPFDLEKVELTVIKEGDKTLKFSNSDTEIEVIATAGHTVGGVCYRYKGDLFTGDTLFMSAVGRWDFPSGDLNALKISVVKLIDTTEEQVVVYPAHGVKTTIGREKRDNGYYREWKNSLNTD